MIVSIVTAQQKLGVAQAFVNEGCCYPQRYYYDNDVGLTLYICRRKQAGWGVDKEFDGQQGAEIPIICQIGLMHLCDMG